jgi:hypothetical protein
MESMIMNGGKVYPAMSDRLYNRKIQGTGSTFKELAKRRSSVNCVELKFAVHTWDGIKKQGSASMLGKNTVNTVKLTL